MKKHKKISKVIISFVLSFVLLYGQSTAANAKEYVLEASSESDDNSNIVSGYIFFDSIPVPYYEDGDVVGDGVALRSQPSSSAPRLELMYFGEEVLVDLSKTSNDWYYVQRKQTKTWGYANMAYIYLRKE